MWPQWTAKVIAFLSLHYPKARFLQYFLHCGICSSSRLFKLDRFHPVPSCSSSFYLQIILSPNRHLLSLSLSLSGNCWSPSDAHSVSLFSCPALLSCLEAKIDHLVHSSSGNWFFFFQAAKMYKSNRIAEEICCLHHEVMFVQWSHANWFSYLSEQIVNSIRMFPFPTKKFPLENFPPNFSRMQVVPRCHHWWFHGNMPLLQIQAHVIVISLQSLWQLRCDSLTWVHLHLPPTL